MRYFIGLAIGLVLLAGVGFWLINQDKPTTDNQPSPQPTSSAANYCQTSQLSAVIDPEVAAGNYYGAIKITNTSSADCQVIGNNQLQIGYPNSVTNFKTEVKKAPTSEVFTLAPNQTIYALIHFPNGPQCSSQAVDVNAMVSYKISPDDSVTFQPTQGTTVDIPSCGKDNEITVIDLYAFSSQEVLPN